MINFQLIEAYDVDIENFNYDVSNMVDSIYIGPQGDLLEKLELFNQSYNSNIGVTKSFTLKPGGYDEIKKAHAKWVLRYDMKPRGITSLFDRIQQYNWRAQHFKRDILEIETRMKNLKHSGMRWQDNTDQFEEEFDRIKVSIINSLNQTREMYPSVDIDCKIIPVNEGRLSFIRRRNHYYSSRQVFPEMFSENAVDFIIMFYIRIKNTDMMVHVMDGDTSAISEYRIPMGDVYIASGTYLLPLISRHWGRTTPITIAPPNNSYSFFLEALYLSNMGCGEHPYIGRCTDKYFWELGGESYSSNICLGNMESEIRNSLINNEIMAHIVQMISWVTNYYVPQTNPLNRVNKLKLYGDDIKFIQWRGDLNSTSTTIFHTHRDDLPNDCNFGKHIYSNMLGYAKNECSNHTYSRSSNTFNQDSIEYPMRLHEYLNTIDLKDMPCNNCGFKSECSQWDILQLVFQDSITPEEEACFGMLYEYHEFIMNIVNRSDGQDYIEIHFAEMSIDQAWRWHLDKDYLMMVMCHKMCIWWAHLSNETFNTSNNRYKCRMRELFNMNRSNMKHLFEYHYLNDESTMSWTLDSIRAYRAPTPDDRLDESVRERHARRQREMADENQSLEHDPVINAWLQQDDSISEDMTPEQRTIQWAIQHGGANNL